MKRRGFLTALLAIPLAFLRHPWHSVIRTRVNPDFTKQFEQSATLYDWLPSGGSIRTEGNDLIITTSRGATIRQSRYQFDFGKSQYRHVATLMKQEGPGHVL